MSSKLCGTVTFLFRDIANGNLLARGQHGTWEGAQGHLRETIELHHGFVFQIDGNAFALIFPWELSIPMPYQPSLL